MTVEESSNSSSQWSREQDKAFENALATYPEDAPDRWEKIAAEVEGKTIQEINQHYEILLEDVNNIESGYVPLPSYTSLSEEGSGKKGGHFRKSNAESSHGSKVSRAEQERRKGIPWTEEEHKKFLLGLEKYGKGDWRSISRNFVVTRTPTQVASHAQKYFIRINSENKDKRRSSIHDITSVDDADVSPITGQSKSGTVVLEGSSGKTSKNSRQDPSGSHTPSSACTPYGVPMHMGPARTYPMAHTG